MAKKIVTRPKKQLSPSLAALRREVTERAILATAAREAGNALNRQDTRVKNAIKTVLDEVGANANDAIVLDGHAYAFRPNETVEIDPVKWFEWYQTKRISKNQFFAALTVSVAEAKRAVGEDQIPDISIKTLTKTAAFRDIELTEKQDDGDIVPFSTAPTKEEVRAEPVASTPKAPTARSTRRVVRIAK